MSHKGIADKIIATSNNSEMRDTQMVMLLIGAVGFLGLISDLLEDIKAQNQTDIEGDK